MFWSASLLFVVVFCLFVVVFFVVFCGFFLGGRGPEADVEKLQPLCESSLKLYTSSFTQTHGAY